MLNYLFTNSLSMFVGDKATACGLQ